MTSKISFSKMSGEEARRLNWMTAVQLLIFGLAIPFRVLMVMASISADQSTDIMYTHAEKLEILCSHIGYDQPENTVLIVAAGILCAYVAFSYLHSAVKLDFYHSLPMRREQLFAAKAVSGISTFVIAYVASQFLAVIFGAVFGCMNGAIIKEMFLATIQGILFFLCSFSGTIVAIMLTGKMLTTLLATVTLCFYVPLLWLIAMMYVDIFWETSLFADVFVSRADALRYTSPWAMCALYEGSGKMGVTGNIPGVSYLLLLALMAAVCLLISLGLYRIRKTEAAEKALAFPKTENLVKLLLTIPAGLVAGAVAYQLYENLLWELLFIVLFGSLACMVMEFIYRWDIRQVLMHKRHIGITIVASAVIFLVMRFDFAGYDTYLPEKSEVAAMAVRSGGEWFTYEGAEGMEEGFSHYGDSSELLDYLETEEFGPIYRLAQEGVSREKAGRHRSIEDYGEITYIYLKYHLKNGKEIYRTYVVDRALYYDVMNEMMKVDGFRERFYPIMNWTEEYQNNLTASCYLYHEAFPEMVSKEENEKRIDISYNKMDEIVEAYQKDLEELTFEEVWDTNFTIDFSSHMLPHYRMIMYPVGPKMTHTLEVLKELAN